MVAAALERFGRLDVAFANAGFGAARGFLKESPEHWRSMVLTNVYGAALTIRATLPALKDARGHLLLTGSVAGRRALSGSLYSATKWAVTAMGESARQELNGTGVRVTLIEPGMVDTPFFDNRRPRCPRARGHRARGACSPSPSRRTSTSTRSWSGRRPRRADRARGGRRNRRGEAALLGRDGCPDRPRSRGRGGRG